MPVPGLYRQHLTTTATLWCGRKVRVRPRGRVRATGTVVPCLPGGGPSPDTVTPVPSFSAPPWVCSVSKVTVPVRARIRCHPCSRGANRGVVFGKRIRPVWLWGSEAAGSLQCQWAGVPQIRMWTMPGTQRRC
jgi:hypothetical protein